MPPDGPRAPFAPFRRSSASAKLWDREVRMALDDASALLDFFPRPEKRRPPREEPEVDELIISHNLHDIYLLLDHLSGRADRSVAGIEVDYGGRPQNLIDAVCRVRWPAKEDQEPWEEAAVLV